MDLPILVNTCYQVTNNNKGDINYYNIRFSGNLNIMTFVFITMLDCIQMNHQTRDELIRIYDLQIPGPFRFCIDDISYIVNIL